MALALNTSKNLEMSTRLLNFDLRTKILPAENILERDNR